MTMKLMLNPKTSLETQCRLNLRRAKGLMQALENNPDYFPFPEQAAELLQGVVSRAEELLELAEDSPRALRLT